MAPYWIRYYERRSRGQKHPGGWGIVEHQIPSIKVLFKTNTKSYKHPIVYWIPWLLMKMSQNICNHGINLIPRHIPLSGIEMLINSGTKGSKWSDEIIKRTHWLNLIQTSKPWGLDWIQIYHPVWKWIFFVDMGSCYNRKTNFVSAASRPHHNFAYI